MQIIHKSITLALFPVLFLGMFFANPALAETITCPLDGGIVASLKPVVDSPADVFSAEITLVNNSAYLMPGVRTAVAFFAVDNPTVPAYWYPLPEVVDLSAGQNITQTIELGMSAIQPGTYGTKVITMQGGEFDLLGAVIRDTETANVTMLLEKLSEPTTNVEIAFSVNGEMAEPNATIKRGEEIEAEVHVTNRSSELIEDIQIISVLAYGDVPLGSAVMSKESDKTPLISDFTRKNRLSSSFVKADRNSSLHSTLLLDKEIMPVFSAKIVVEKGIKQPAPLSYISSTGVSNTEVLTCVSYINDPGYKKEFYDPLGLELNIQTQNGAENYFQKKYYNDEVNHQGFFVFKTQMPTENFSLKTDLYHMLHMPNIDEESDLSLTQQIKDRLTITQTQTHVVNCENNQVCQAPQAEVVGSSFDARSILYYSGIILASILLMVLMIGRLKKREIAEPIIGDGTELK
jgi:hypothetical protein